MRKVLVKEYALQGTVGTQRKSVNSAEEREKNSNGRDEMEFKVVFFESPVTFYCCQHLILSFF